MTEGEVKHVYVGVPGFVANGDPLDDAILDAVVEAMEVEPRDVQVIEMNNKFYVFIKSLPFTFTTANQTVARAADLSKTYEHSVVRLTKLVRRSDKYQNDLHTLRKEVAALRAERDALKAKLEVAQVERAEQIQMSKAVESDLQALINTLGTQ